MTKFLIIDDNVPTARILTRLLQSVGHDAAFVSSGRAALERLERDRPDVIVLDWLMPEMDGFEVLRNIRADRRLDDVRVVMFSAVSDPTRVGDTLRMGAQDYVVKGTPWGSLYPRLREPTGPCEGLWHIGAAGV